MRRYLLLTAASSNRVYAGEAPRLTVAELSAFGERVLGARPRNPAPVTVAGVPYVEFTTDEPLSERDLRYLSCLSTAYALFEAEGELLRPVPLTPPARYDEDLVTIPKYAGKTNEQFTRLLLNVTVLASVKAAQMTERRLVVLDPLAGRGTTLNHALRYGYDAIGIEIDGRHVDAYSAFLHTWLRRKRIKHTVELTPIRRDKRKVARRLTATVAPTKEAMRGGDVQRVTMLHADAVAARDFLHAGCCDVIVTDTPYGVAHGSLSRGGGALGALPPGARERNPLDLLEAALPGWVELLRQGGALGLAVNVHVAPRDKVRALLEQVGLTVVDSPAYEGFAHWVDQGITRDVVVAVKPKPVAA